MAKTFVNPQVLELDIENTEVNGFGGSGGGTPSSWDISFKYTSHNTGHHSVVAIKGVRNGSSGGNWVLIHVGIKAPYRLAYVKDSGGYEVTNVSESGFSIKRTNWFNGTDRFDFNIQIVVKNGYGPLSQNGEPAEGSVTYTGNEKECDLFCVSAFEGL